MLVQTMDAASHAALRRALRAIVRYTVPFEIRGATVLDALAARHPERARTMPRTGIRSRVREIAHGGRCFTK